MTNVFLYENFREFLKDELKSRVLRNSKYSLRAFARDLGISFSHLSEILSMDSGVSPSKGQTMAKNLKMTFIESEYFSSLISADCGRSAKERNHALLFIKQYKARKKFISLSRNYQKLICKWYYVPLIELLEMKSERQISKILGISEEEVWPRH